MSHHHHCHGGGDWWMLLALLVIMDSQDKGQPTQPPKPPSGGDGCAQGCGSCLGSLLMLGLLIAGILWVIHSNQKPDPRAAVRTVTPAVYSYTEPPTPAVPTIDVAPRAAVSQVEPEPTPDYAPRAIPVDTVVVCRAELVALPVRRGILIHGKGTQAPAR